MRRTIVAPPEGLPGAIAAWWRSSPTSSGTIGEVPGYGPKGSAADDASVLHWKQARLWARLEFVVGTVLIGLWSLYAMWQLASVPLRMVPVVLVWNALAVFGGLACLWAGTWFALRPAIAWDDRGIELRHRPWRAPIRVTPREVVWRPDSRYVGRYLFAHPAGRSPVRFPLWMIRRGGARRLFAYLDRSDVARE